MTVPDPTPDDVTAIAERPRCPRGHGYMTLRTQTSPEQEWCGTWYDCPPDRPGESCRSASLLPSPALVESWRVAREAERGESR